MKAKQAGPDLFGRASEIAKKEKPKAAPDKPRNTIIAEVSGCIAGLPECFVRAIKELEDAESRCARSDATTGILTQLQHASVRGMSAQIREMLGHLHKARKTVDAIIQEGIAVSTLKPDLF